MDAEATNQDDPDRLSLWHPSQARGKEQFAWVTLFISYPHTRFTAEGAS